MSIRITACIVCESCGKTLEATEHRSTYAKLMVGRLKDAAQRARWLTVSRGRYRTEHHYCPACADGPAPAALQAHVR